MDDTWSSSYPDAPCPLQCRRTQIVEDTRDTVSPSVPRTHVCECLVDDTYHETPDPVDNNLYPAPLRYEVKRLLPLTPYHSLPPSHHRGSLPP